MKKLFARREPGYDWFTFQWHITDACDQRCRHCYIHQNPPETLLQTSWLQMLETLDKCEDFCRQMDFRLCMNVTGGDPLLHPDVRALAQELHRRRIPFVVMGNPFHLTSRTCRWLRRMGCIRYQLSVDGLEDTHDWFRQPGSFRATMEAIRMLRRARLPVAVMTTVSSRNIDEVTSIFDTVARLGADIYSFARYCPVGEEKDNGIAPAQWRQLLAEVEAKFCELREAGCRTLLDRKDHLWTLYQYETGAFTPRADAVEGAVYGGCHCGGSHLTILPDGTLMACRRVPDSCVGNILTDSLTRIWIRDMERYRRLDRFVRCGSCELLRWCRGCPAVARCSGENFYDADPQCWKE